MVRLYTIYTVIAIATPDKNPSPMHAPENRMRKVVTLYKFCHVLNWILGIWRNITLRHLNTATCIYRLYISVVVAIAISNSHVYIR